MNFQIEHLIQQIKGWFPKAQAHIEAQAADLDARFKDEQNYTRLSPEEIADYQNKIRSLSLPEVYQNETKNKILKVLKQWKKDKSSVNHLFVLVSPIEATKVILNQTLEEIDDETLRMELLSWTARPDEYSTFKSQLNSKLESGENDPETNNNQTPESLVIIPDLSLCFLRCIEGLDGIEYLFDLILKDRSRFWLVGCNQWAWNYFDYLYKVNTCFEHIFHLPTLNAVQLKQWLTPVYENLDLEFANNQNDADNQDNEWREEDNWISPDEKQYFERLADISEGLSQPAAYLWLDSLRYLKQPEETDSETVELGKNQPEKQLILKRATLPDLPELTKEDQYLLSSIGLHGEISLSALAVSLGDPENLVRIQVQRLLRTRIIWGQQEQFRLSPNSYPRLKRDLIDNQILAGEQD